MLSSAVENVVNGDTMQEWSDETGNPITYGPPEEADDVLERVWTDIPDVVDVEELREAAE